MGIDRIQKLCEENSIHWTDHAIKRIIQRGITRAEVKHVLSVGKIIEEYPEDYPYPSCLIVGTTVERRHIHVVCGVANDELWIISVYIPNPEEWVDAFSKRKEKN